MSNLTPKPEWTKHKTKAVMSNHGYVLQNQVYWKYAMAYPDCGIPSEGETVNVLGRYGISLLIVPIGYTTQGKN
jgi:hypothetical protein